MRLTPATQDRRGWIWNNAAVGEENWEVEFQVQVGMAKMRFVVNHCTAIINMEFNCIINCMYGFVF